MPHRDVIIPCARRRGQPCMLVYVTEPAMLVLESDETELDVLRETLRRRYDRQYLVPFESSAAAAADRLTQLAAAGARSQSCLPQRRRSRALAVSSSPWPTG